MAKKNEEQPKTDIEKTQSAPLAPAPDYITDGREGFDNVDAQDVMFERLCMMQSKSPEVEESKYADGDLVRRSTEEVLYTRGGAKIPFVIAYYFKEYVEFGDRDNPAEPAIIGRTTDRKSALAEEARQWKKKKMVDGKEVRKVQDVHNFIILIEGKPFEPVQIGFMKTSFKYGSGLLTLANGIQNKPIYAGRYLLYTHEDQNKKRQRFNVLKAQRDIEQPWASEALYKAAQELNQMMAEAHKKGQLKGDYTTDDIPDGDSAGDDVGDPDLS